MPSHALSAKLGNIANISLFEPTDENLFCKVLLGRKGSEAERQVGDITNISLLSVVSRKHALFCNVLL